MTQIANSLSRWALPLSIALNVFLIALVGVHEWSHAWHGPGGPGGPGGPPRPGQMIEHLARGLSPSDAAALREAFASEPSLGQDDHKNMVEDMEKVRQAMRADPFDPAALAAALNRGHEIRDNRDQAIGRVLVKAATALSPEGRRQLADRGPGGPGGPGGPDGPHGPPPGPPR